MKEVNGIISPELKSLVELKLAINESLYKDGIISKEVYEKAKIVFNNSVKQ